MGYVIGLRRCTPFAAITIETLMFKPMNDPDAMVTCFDCIVVMTPLWYGMNLDPRETIEQRQREAKLIDLTRPR